MKKNNPKAAALLALLAAAFYALNVPLSKRLLEQVPATCMAAFLYLGAGVGIGILYAFHYKKEDRSERLTKSDIPYTVAMILLDILAPILLMLGIRIGSAANASLLNNFEIVATALVALLVFKEKVSRRLWLAIALITASGIILSFEGSGSFSFSLGSLLVLSATCCWGIENNCTRSISGKSTYEIVTLKGIFSGCGSLVVSLIIGEKIPALKYVLLVMLLGFVAYGLSIFLYVRAQSVIGAAKTSAYYAVAPFIGSGLSFIMGGETFTLSFGIALAVMIAGTTFVVRDTLAANNEK